MSSPMITTQVLSLVNSPLLPDLTIQRKMVGALQYATISQPDIAFVVNKVCQFMHAPTENHWATVKQILCYLQGTVNYRLLIRQNSGSSLQLFTDVHQKHSVSDLIHAFSDSDKAGCLDDLRSTGGFVIYMGSKLISWTARKQRTVSRSSTEYEYKALVDTIAEVI